MPVFDADAQTRGVDEKVRTPVVVGAVETGELTVRAPDSDTLETVREVAPLTLQEIEVLFPSVMVEGVAVNTEITGTDAA